MANGATEFSLDAVRDFMLCRGGRVTNHELVQHFKSFLTNTDNKELARDQFKQYVNTLSHVVKEENNKYLVLKKKYCVDTPLTSSNIRPSDPHVLQSPDSNFNPAQYSQNHAPHNVSIPNEFAVSPQAAASSGRGYLFHDRGPEIPGEQMPKMTDFNQRYGNQQSQGIQQNDAASPYGQQFQRRDSNSSFGGAVPNQDYSAPPLPPRQIASPYNGGAPPAARLRTPPPYRPPPPPPESPKIMDPSLMHNPHGNPNFGPSYNSHEYNRFPAPGAIGHPSGLTHQISAHEYRSPDPYPKEHHRRPSYEAHSEQDFRNHNRSSSFDEPSDLGIPVPQSFPASSQHQQSNQGLIPLSATKRTGPRQAPSHPDGMLQSRSRKNKYDSPPSDASQASSDDSSELRAADRGRSHNQVDRNKENFEPPTHSIAMQSKQDMPNNPDGDAESLAPPTTGGNEKKISVKEKTQIFNRMASETNLGDKLLKNGSKSNRSSRAEKDYDDTKSILSYGQDGQDWLVAAASSDFNEILRLLKAHPELIRRKDRHNGYTALHWAAKHGRAEVVRLLAGTYQADPNARSNGGYTPLHLAAHYNRQDVFDLLVHYGSDLNLRDYSGKKPRQYNTIASSTISPEHQKRIVQRRNSIKDSASFLRIGSLNVKVRRTTEAFNALLSRDSNAVEQLRHLHKNYGSSDSLTEERESGSNSSSKLMPPPIFGPMKKRKLKKERSEICPGSASSSASSRPISSPLLSSLSSSLASLSSTSSAVSKPGGASSGPVLHHNFVSQQNPTNVNYNSQQIPTHNAHRLSVQQGHDSDSDNACGFGSDWQ